MAAVARSGPADARSPCPLCGGLIHPIAGRCKHCKGDLRALRSARPAAGATLPALGQPAPAPHAGGHAPTNGHHPAAPAPAPSPFAAPPAQPPQSLVQAVAAVAPIPLAIHHGPADAAPILPPRPTGRFPAAAPRASWKSWPVIVIVLAVIAIVTAVVLMVFPPGGSPGAAEMNHSLQPAPDRMDTNPTPATPRQPPSTSPDPWSRGGGAAAPTAPTVPTTPPAMPPDDPDIDDPDVDDALSGRDPFSRRGGLGGGAAGGLGGLGAGLLGPRSTQTLIAMLQRACARLEACNSMNAQLEQLCETYTQIPSLPPPRCAAAARCLRSIDEMSCDVAIDDPMSLFQLKDRFTDCVDAMSC